MTSTIYPRLDEERPGDVVLERACDAAKPHTFIDMLDRVAHLEHKGFTFLDSKLEAERWSFSKLVAEARRRGRYLRSRGLAKGDRLAIMIPGGRDFILSFFGAVTASIIPVPIYPPVMLDRMQSYLQGAERILRTAEARMLLASDHLVATLAPLATKLDTLEACLSTEDFATADPPSFETDVTIAPDDICFLQFTSGSTSDSKGVVVTHGNLCANAHAIVYHGLVIDPDKDVAISWLPMFHDMGLIGFALSPILAQVDVVIIPTSTFVRRPHVWMSTISKYRGTMTFAPNFAFALAAKRMRNIEQLDLRCLRVLGCGAEPINPNTMRRFIEVFQPAGLSPEALLPCYGLAEATLAVTFGELGAPMRTATIDREIYEAEHRAVIHHGDPSLNSTAAIELVSCGTSFEDHEVAVVDQAGRPREEGWVGEVVLRGPSVAIGYYNNPEATRVILRHGWLHTGDLGFVLDGELYISGRIKDIIILNGCNYYPQAIEWEVESLEGIYQGNVVAFASPGEDSERLIIVAKAKTKDKEGLIATVRRRVTGAFGLDPKEVILISDGPLPKTSSGKLQRRKTKAQYEAGRFEPTF